MTMRIRSRSIHLVVSIEKSIEGYEIPEMVRQDFLSSRNRRHIFEIQTKPTKAKIEYCEQSIHQSNPDKHPNPFVQPITPFNIIFCVFISLASLINGSMVTPSC